MPTLDIDHLFTYQPPTAEQKDHYDTLTALFKQLGHAIQLHCPDSAERRADARDPQAAGVQAVGEHRDRSDGRG